MIPGFNVFHEGLIVAFVLVLIRISSFVVALPAIGGSNVPVMTKIFLALALSILLFPVVQSSTTGKIAISSDVIMMAGREVVIGLILGFIFRFFFFTLSVAGELIGLSSGLSSAQIFNPSVGSTVNVFEQLFLTLSTVLLFALNGHHLFVQGIAQSFEVLPLGVLGLNLNKYNSFFSLAGDTFLMGVKLAAPVVVAIFLANLSLGILGRAVPQLNAFMTSLQVTILLCLAVMLVTLPVFSEEMSNWLGIVTGRFFDLMKVI